MEDVVTKIGKRGTLVIPAKIREVLNLTDNDPVSIHVEESSGKMVITPQLSVDRSKAWFLTPEWQAGEREADEDLKAGRFEVMTAEEFKKDIRVRASEEDHSSE